MQQKFIIIFIVVLVLAAGLSYYLGYQLGGKKGYDLGVKDTDGAYKELLEKAGTPVVNPIENLPSANPFAELKVNPFEGIKTNPFK